MERVSAQRLAEWVADARERWSVPGIAVGLFLDGETVVFADGVCELGGDEGVSPETAFRIASITKPFTATLALALAQDGLLALDEPPPGSRGHEQTEPGSDEHVVFDHPYPKTRTPSGGLWSTVGDLLRFADHHLGGPGPLSRESVQELQQPHIPAPGGSYGLGWFLR